MMVPAQAGEGALGEEPSSTGAGGGSHGLMRRPAPFSAQQGGAWIERFLGRMPTPATPAGLGAAHAPPGRLWSIQEKQQPDTQPGSQGPGDTGITHPPGCLGALGPDSLRHRHPGEGAAPASNPVRGGTFLAHFAGQRQGSGPASSPAGGDATGPLRAGRGEAEEADADNEVIISPCAWPLSLPQPALGAQAKLDPGLPGGTPSPLSVPVCPCGPLHPLLPAAPSGALWASEGSGAGQQALHPNHPAALPGNGSSAPTLSAAASAVQRPQAAPAATASISASRAIPGNAAAQASQDVVRWAARPPGSHAGNPKLPQSPGTSADSDVRQERAEDASDSEEGPRRAAGEAKAASQPRGTRGEAARSGLREGGQDGALSPSPALRGPEKTSSTSRGGSHGSSRRVSEASMRAWRRDAADALSSLAEVAETRLGMLEQGLPFALPPSMGAPGEAAILGLSRGVPLEEGPGEHSLAPGLPPFLQAQAARAALGMPIGRRALEKGPKCLRCGALGHCFLLCSEWGPSSAASEGPHTGASIPELRHAQVEEALRRGGLFAKRASPQVLPWEQPHAAPCGPEEAEGEADALQTTHPNKGAGEGGLPGLARSRALAASQPEVEPLSESLVQAEGEERAAPRGPGRAPAEAREAEQLSLLWTPACISCLGQGHWAAECEVMDERMEGTGVALSPGPGTTDRTQRSSGTRSGAPRRKRRRTSAWGSSGAWGSQSAAHCSPAANPVDGRHAAEGPGVGKLEPGPERGGVDSLPEAHDPEGEGGAAIRPTQSKGGCESKMGMMGIVWKEEGAQGRVRGGSAQEGRPMALPSPPAMLNKLWAPSGQLPAAETHGDAGPGAPGRSPSTPKVLTPKVGELDTCGAANADAGAGKAPLQSRGGLRGVLEELESIRLSRKHIAR